MAASDTAIKRSSLLPKLGADVHEVFLSFLSQEELSALCLVSRESRWLSEPHLYSKIDWYWSLRSEPPILLFLRTILERPVLAEHIRHVALRGAWQTISWTGQTYHPGWQRALERNLPGEINLTLSQTEVLDLDKVVSVLDSIEGPPEVMDVWAEGIKVSQMDALVALLLSRASNIEYLSIDGRFVVQTAIVGHMFKLAVMDKVANLPRFHRLKEVRHAPLYIEEEYYGTDVAKYQPYFALPAIETLLTPLDNSQTLASVLQQFSALQTLRYLKVAQCQETQLKSLLAICPNLQSFSWETLSLMYEGPSHVMDLDKLGNALVPYQHSLRSLAVSARWLSESSWRITIDGDLTWIQNFDGLRDLALDIVLLDRVMLENQIRADNLLPKSLQNLMLYHDDHNANFGNDFRNTRLTSAMLIEIANDYFRSIKDTRPELNMFLVVTDNHGTMSGIEERRILQLARNDELKILIEKPQHFFQ